MEASEIEILIGELETRVDRLRALYEQYFMGIEKIEPTVQRKDVERRIYVLRRVQIRNTALRFRFNNTIQRLNTMQQYWARIVREIENGTYKRDVRRAAARFGTDALTGAAKKRLGRMLEQIEGERAHDRDHDIDVDVEMDEFADEVSADDLVEEPAEQPIAPVRRSLPQHAGFGELHDEEFHSPDFGDGEGFGAADVGFGSLPEFDEAPPRAAPMARATASKPVVPSFLEPEEYDGAEWGASPAQRATRPTTPAPPPPEPARLAPATDPAPPPQPRATSPSVERAAGTSPSGGLLSSAAGVRRAPGTGSSDPGPRPASGPAPSPLPKATPSTGALSRSPSPAPRVPSPYVPTSSNAAAKAPASLAPQAAAPITSGAAGGAQPQRAAVPAGTAGGAQPQRAAVPAGTAGGAQPQRAAVPAGTAGGGQPQRAAVPAGTAGGGQPQRAAVPAATARAAAAQTSSPKAPAASQPKPSDGSGPESHGLSNERVRKIYESYVQARRACRESTSNITEGKLDEMLKSSAAKLRGKHGAKNIDFDVVIKDGKAVLKPVVKG